MREILEILHLDDNDNEEEEPTFCVGCGSQLGGVEMQAHDEFYLNYCLHCFSILALRTQTFKYLRQARIYN